MSEVNENVATAPVVSTPTPTAVEPVHTTPPHPGTPSPAIQNAVQTAPVAVSDAKVERTASEVEYLQDLYATNKPAAVDAYIGYFLARTPAHLQDDMKAMLRDDLETPPTAPIEALSTKAEQRASSFDTATTLGVARESGAIPAQAFPITTPRIPVGAQPPYPQTPDGEPVAGTVQPGDVPPLEPTSYPSPTAGASSRSKK